MAVKEETVAVSDERSKALKLAIEKIEKDFGKGSIMKLGDKPAVSVETIPTGSLSLVCYWFRRNMGQRNRRGYSENQ